MLAGGVLVACAASARARCACGMSRSRRAWRSDQILDLFAAAQCRHRLLEVFVLHGRRERLLKSTPHLAQVPRCLLPRPVPLESSAGTPRVTKEKRMETLLSPSVLLFKSQLPHEGAIPTRDVRETDAPVFTIHA